MPETNRLTKTVSSRDAAPEPAGMHSRRVSVNLFVSGTVSDPRRSIYANVPVRRLAGRPLGRAHSDALQSLLEIVHQVVHVFQTHRDPYQSVRNTHPLALRLVDIRVRHGDRMRD